MQLSINPMKFGASIVCASILCILTAYPTRAAERIFDNGILIGANGVDVDGRILNVVFQDGTCAEVFSGCDEDSDFLFGLENIVQITGDPSAALAQQVLPGVTPTSINGCGIHPTNPVCQLFTPFDAFNSSGNVSVSVALAVSPTDSRSVGSTSISPNDDFTEELRTTFAVWSLATPLPECSDGVDNDGDFLIDFPGDPGCETAEDDSESDSTSGSAAEIFIVQRFGDDLLIEGRGLCPSSGELPEVFLGEPHDAGTAQPPTSCQMIETFAAPLDLLIVPFPLGIESGEYLFTVVNGADSETAEFRAPRKMARLA
jgi:hypothetical protein